MRFPKRGRGNRVGNAPLLPGDQAGIGKQNSAAMIEYLKGDKNPRSEAASTPATVGLGAVCLLRGFTEGRQVKNIDKNTKTIIKEVEVRGPVSQQEADAGTVVFKTFGVHVAGQYLNCRMGGERGKVRLYHLVRSADEAIIGFMGLETLIEELGDKGPANAWMSVEYVYLMPQFRGQGLSYAFLRKAVARFKPWLRRVIAKYGSDRLIAISGSAPVSTEGDLFCDRLNEHLRGWCARQGVEFRP